MDRRSFLKGLLVAAVFPKVSLTPQVIRVGNRVMVRSGVLDYDFARRDGYRDIGGWTGTVDEVTDLSVWVVFDEHTIRRWTGAYRRGLIAHGFRESEPFSFNRNELIVL